MVGIGNEKLKVKERDEKTKISVEMKKKDH